MIDKRADRMQTQPTEHQTEEIQAEMIAKSGLRFALNRLSTSSIPISNSRTTLPLFGGTMTYEIISRPFDPEHATVISTGILKKQKVVITATVSKMPEEHHLNTQQQIRNNWMIEKEYMNEQVVT